MANAARARLARVVLTAGFMGALTASGQAAQPDQQHVLELRVFAYATLDAAGIETARQATGALLAAAGVQATWRECGTGDGCPDSARTGPFVRVHLLPIARSSDPSISADAVRSASGPRVALVYVPSLQDTVRQILQSPAGQSTPELSTLTLAHLAGIAIAHEVGHTLGLPHAHGGVMKARLDAQDVAAARRLELGFGASEGKRMRLALQREALALADLTSRGGSR